MATSTQAELSIPPLVEGDLLSRDEFERRYDAMPDLKKAELIDGVVYMGSPVDIEQHSEPHFDLIGWMSYYRWFTPGVRGSDNGSIHLDPRSMPQPDVFLRIMPESGGQTRVGVKGYLEGAPELVAEVANSTVSHDLKVKLEAYRRNGAKEYLLWRVQARAIDWFVLREGQYLQIEPSPEGLIKSETFPGLWLDPEALIREDMAALLAALQLGLATPEHAAFVVKLAAAPREGRT